MDRFIRRRQARVARRTAVGLVVGVAAVASVVGLELSSHAPPQTTLAVQGSDTTSPSGVVPSGLKPPRHSGTAPAAATENLTGSIHLTKTTVVAGRPISGHLLIDNPTHAAVSILHACPGEAFAVVLEGRGVVADPGWDLILCTGALRVPAGISSYPITVSTRYGYCVGRESEATSQTPYCRDSVLPPLAAGHYQAGLITNGFTIHQVLSVPVTLAPADK